ncbi:MAG TPA: peptidylprolyl isomerase [Bryobacteraceae bacterium]|nr:peptidylprolyl isomerase [Bryobacteraceae bacterium]
MKACFLLAAFSAAAFAQLPGAPAVPAQPSPDSVVATVGGMKVTLGEIRGMLKDAPPQISRFFKQNPQGFIQQMFLFQYLAAEGDKAKLGEKSPLKEELEAQRKWVIANEEVNHERDGYQVTAEEINKFYAAHQDRWEQAKIKAILIAFKPAPKGAAKSSADIAEAAREAFENAHPNTDPKQRSEADAQKLAADIVTQLRGGADFSKLVAQYSDDASSKAKGGDFDDIKATSAYPADLKKAIFALKPGQISDPVRQPTGFYIIKMEQKSVQPLNDVRGPIVQELRQTHLNEWLQQLNARFKPTVQMPQFFTNPEQYVTIPNQPLPAPKP